MGLKSLANKAKGKRPIVEEKKSKLNVEEQMVEEISSEKASASAEVWTEVGFQFHFRFPPF